MNNNLIFFSGCDGSGKTSILESLIEQLCDATYIKEPTDRSIIDESDIFKKIDLFAWNRYNLYKDISFPPNKTIISDRSFICSLVYQSLEIEEHHGWPPFTAIQHVYNQQLVIIPPTLVIYIHADPSTIYRRLQSRNDNEHMTIEQIKRIQSRYQLIFKLFNLTVIPIDTTSIPISINVSKIISHIS